MPRPLPLPLRRVLLRRSAAGQPAGRIAADLGLAPRTVRRLVAACRRRGPGALAPAYRTGPVGPPPSRQGGYQAAGGGTAPPGRPGPRPLAGAPRTWRGT